MVASLIAAVGVVVLALLGAVRLRGAALRFSHPSERKVGSLVGILAGFAAGILHAQFVAHMPLGACLPRCQGGLFISSL
jgi:hypothetical protein